MWFQLIVDSSKEEVTHEGKTYKVGGAIIPDDTGFLWELRKTKLYGFHICHFIGEKFVYQVPLKKSGTYHMGDNYGYREKLEEEEQDPIRRVLCKYRLSASKLVEDDLKQTTLRRSSFALEREIELPSGSKAKGFVTDGKVTKLDQTDPSGYTQYELDGHNYYIEYTLMHGRYGYMYMIEKIAVNSGATDSIRVEIAERLEALIMIGYNSIQSVKELIVERNNVFGQEKGIGYQG